ncbi:hypothetical protein OHU11_18040 [Streptomyces sp. NBC_00257]|uniref:Integral membrane protein n=2 Tax=Streptomyces TaxID=1883 RepID=A0ABW2WW48_9ACTN|nr:MULTISPECIES: hypothetical protein [Streptomyces]WSW05916.1 hypothetical protein OG298_16875 [Streptomyces sp. NBC_01005]WTB56246.1 hypothetical protein OG832_25375 [Streptomyces sp. NBC_00826]WTC95420.1 hypothetical protein OH736_16880 [Streptomyces sp. NBC_01650]WTH90872.1 hypothetical protein OIC43_18320 [Streptomyces sp. NBC_00825]WTH99598.1 hypothetical protein OHA23_18305 [Streptomyces sp. NBC_00822]
MSQPVPPPNQPHDAQPGGNPFAGQQPGAPTGNPFAGQQPGDPSGNPFAGQQPGMPFAPPAPARNNLGLGLAAGFVAAVVAAAIYGAIIGATKHEIGYAAVGVGFIVGFAAGKVGGRNPVLPVVSAVLSLVAVYFGQLLGEAMIAAKELPVTVSELFFDHFSLLNEAWKADSDFISYLFFAVAAVAAFSGAKKAGE